MSFTPFVPTDKVTMNNFNEKFQGLDTNFTEAEVRLMSSIEKLENTIGQIEMKITSVLPTGSIIMWNGDISTIPTNWNICNGTNGTPDLRDRFIVGAGSRYNKGSTGGATTVTLTTGQLPSHTHLVDRAIAESQAAGGGFSYTPPETYGVRTTQVNTSATGSTQPHENRPPYYALYYIMKIA